jgi:hypothetical protein
MWATIAIAAAVDITTAMTYIIRRQRHGRKENCTKMSFKCSTLNTANEC